MSLLSHGWFLLCAIGVAVGLVQLVALVLHLRRRPQTPTAFLPVSVLKPLCGLDDDLADHLERFATLTYPRYELLLGVRSTGDAAWPLACAAAARHPGRVRVVVQQGEPGRNPKVNQLITLAAAARHDVLVISDSNVTVEADYLDDIAARFEDPAVGVVTHAVTGVGERSLGAAVDNLHLSAGVGPGMIAAQRVLGQDLVVGKSMAVRRSDMARVGGFEAMRDVLAEDFYIGRRIGGELGKRIVVAPGRVWNVSRRRSLGDFLLRYRRWAVMHRMAAGTWLYLTGVALNPTATALLALASAPSWSALEWVAVVTGARVALDGLAGGLLRQRRFGLWALAAVPLKDLLFFAAWLHGLTHDTVVWRGNRLRVLPGTRLAPPEAEPALGAVAEPQALGEA